MLAVKEEWGRIGVVWREEGGRKGRREGGRHECIVPCGRGDDLFSFSEFLVSRKGAFERCLC